MRQILLCLLGLSSLSACGPTPQQQAFAAQVETQCRAGDIVACHQRDGDPVEVARLEVACASQNLQACQAVSHYRLQQQNLRNQQAAATQANLNAMAARPAPQHPTYTTPQVQPVQLSSGTNYYYCNQLGSYVVTCR